jgi:hypothetical protein
MNEGEIKKVLAVTLTSIAVMLTCALNILLPIFGSIVIMFIGMIWTAAIASVYGE